MVTLEDIERELCKYERQVTSCLSPMKVWQFLNIIKPKIEQLKNVRVVYPKYLFDHPKDVFKKEKNIEIIILTDEKLFLGKYEKKDFNIKPMEVSKVKIDINEDRNDVSKIFNLDFSQNICEIKKFIS